MSETIKVETTKDASGKNILEIKDFQIQELSGGLFRVSCQTSDGTEQSVILSERSAS